MIPVWSQLCTTHSIVLALLVANPSFLISSGHVTLIIKAFYTGTQSSAVPADGLDHGSNKPRAYFCYSISSLFEIQLVD